MSTRTAGFIRCEPFYSISCVDLETPNLKRTRASSCKHGKPQEHAKQTQTPRLSVFQDRHNSLFALTQHNWVHLAAPIPAGTMSVLSTARSACHKCLVVLLTIPEGKPEGDADEHTQQPGRWIRKILAGNMG